MERKSTDKLTHEIRSAYLTANRPYMAIPLPVQAASPAAGAEEGQPGQTIFENNELLFRHQTAVLRSYPLTPKSPSAALPLKQDG